MPERIRKKVQVHLYRCLAPGRHVFLILQRTPEKDAVWQCVTGNVDPGEKVEECAVREVREETGLTLAGPGVGEVWQYRFTKAGVAFDERVFGFEAASEDVRLSHEHQGFRWVGADEALERIHYDGIREGLRHVVRALESQ